MIIVHKKTFFMGLFMAIVFGVVLFLMFSPLFNGQNAFEASDKLFNSIAKGSTYYIPALKKDIVQHLNHSIDLSCKLKNKEMAQNTEKVLSSVCTELRRSDLQLEAKCSLGRILDSALNDSDSMFHNRGEEISSKYRFGEKKVLHTWWVVLKEVEKTLTAQKKFVEASFVNDVITRGVEVGYNFYKIEPEDITSKWQWLVLALIFYICYTLWWGFAIFFLVEGLGMELKRRKKKEV